MGSSQVRRVRVKWIDLALRELIDLLRALGPPANLPGCWAMLIETIRPHLEKHDGQPPESQLFEHVLPESRVWEIVRANLARLRGSPESELLVAAAWRW